MHASRHITAACVGVGGEVSWRESDDDMAIAAAVAAPFTSTMPPVVLVVGSVASSVFVDSGSMVSRTAETPAPRCSVLERLVEATPLFRLVVQEERGRMLCLASVLLYLVASCA